MQYTKERPLRVFTAFSGYDSQCLALDRLARNNPSRFAYELVGWSEIDQHAIMAHNALYPAQAEKNLGDISKIDWANVPDFDLFTYSFPCQDISQAGNQKGFDQDSGTRSSLLWECENAVRAKKPKFLLMENVAALVSKKFLPMFNLWQQELEKLGYVNFLPPAFPTPWKEGKKTTRANLINAADMGIPQNRERVFLVSIRVDDKNHPPQYNFPYPFPLEQHLIDVLEEEVDEKYFISDKMLSYFRRVSKDAKVGKNITTT